MAGYSRQSVADIIANAVIKAAPVNAEYNAIRDAFAFAGGHKHDGSSTEGAYVPLIADTDALNKVVIDTANNRIGVFVEVSAAAVEQIRIQDGAIVPVTDNDIDLGASGTKFKNLYVNGIASIGSITLSGGTIDNTVIGGTTPAAADFTTMDASGNATVGGTFGVTGNTTIGGTLGVTGVTTLGTANITSVDLNSGAIDGTTIGAATPAAGTFTVLTANTSLTAATADINGGTLDGVTIGGTVSAAATVTNLTATGTSTLSTVDINAGAIDGTTIGATSHTTGKFTTLQSTGLATLNSVNIDGGNIDGTVIGNTSAAAITGTTITGTSFVGPVTGNVTGNLTGNVTGNVTGDVTGNITSSGSSSFNNVTIDGTLNMNAGTTATITNLTSPTNTNDAATKGYVDTSISNLVDSAPGTLDTLNELAAALGDDPNFSTTITNSIATKLPLAGGTMTGAIAMSTNKITGLGDPTAAQDAMTKAYADSNYLALSGGTMTGAIDMGSAKITTTYTPTNAADLTTKTYVDGILGSATAASASAAAAATSETNAATSESNAATSESNAAASATSAATLYDNFDDRYLGAKASAPTVDNDGDALITGALYFNTTTNIMNVYGSSGWQSAGSAVNGTSDRVTYTASSGQTIFSATYDAGYVDVYMNGVKLLAGTDFTATNGTSIQLASGAALNDIIDIVAYGTFVLADHYSKSQSDARYVEVAGDTMTGNLDVGGTVTADGLTVDGNIALRNADNITFKDTGGTNRGILTFDVNNDIIVGPAGAGIQDIKFKNNGAKTRLDIDVGGDISFYEDTGTTAKFFWDASAEKLGLNTTSPAALLDLKHNSASTHLRLTENTSGNWSAFGVDTSDNLRVYVNNTERMRIDSNGRVAIGGTTVTDVNMLNIQGSGASSNIGVVLNDTNTSKVYGIQNGGSALKFFDYTASTERMRIASNGNVGIGTSSPSQKLTISGGTSDVAMLWNSTDTAYYNFGILKNGSLIQMGEYNNAGDTLAESIFNIEMNGNKVGVGTTTPSHPLTSVVSVASSDPLTDGSNYALGIQNTDSTAGNAVSMAFGHGGYNYTNFISSIRTGTGTDPKGDLTFGGRPSDGATFVERMRITSGGSVIIDGNNTDGSHKLQIGEYNTVGHNQAEGETKLIHIDDSYVMRVAREHNSGDIASTGWYSVAKIPAFGTSGKCTVSMGGDFTADVVEIDWISSVNTALNNSVSRPRLRASGTFANVTTPRITQARIARATSDSQYYIQVYVASGVNNNTNGKSLLEVRVGDYVENSQGSIQAMFNAFSGTTTHDWTVDVIANGVQQHGIHTKPEQPSFRVGKTAATSGIQDIVFDTEFHDIGNNYNTSNGRFTCPVDGTYYFGWQGISNISTTSNEQNVSLLVNGTAVNDTRFRGYTEQSGHIKSILNLSAGDYVQIKATNGNTTLFGSTFHNQFMGYLLG